MRIIAAYSLSYEGHVAMLKSHLTIRLFFFPESVYFSKTSWVNVSYLSLYDFKRYSIEYSFKGNSISDSSSSKV